jgi:hypothetical protein
VGHAELVTPVVVKNEVVELVGLASCDEVPSVGLDWRERNGLPSQGVV